MPRPSSISCIKMTTNKGTDTASIPLNYNWLLLSFYLQYDVFYFLVFFWIIKTCAEFADDRAQLSTRILHAAHVVNQKPERSRSKDAPAELVIAWLTVIAKKEIFNLIWRIRRRLRLYKEKISDSNKMSEFIETIINDISWCFLLQVK
jgi:hypothetical protein